MKQILLVSTLAVALMVSFFLGSNLQTSTMAQTTTTTTTPNRTISITGSGVVTATPDAITANIGVTSLETSLEESLADNNTKMTEIVDLLKSLGIEDRDIQTANFNVNIERENYNGPITGYRVSNTVAVTIRDFDVAGSVLDQAVRAGANEIYGIRLTISDPAALESQARVLAVADAMAKAEEMVNAAGAQLGQVLSMSAHASSPMMSEFREFDMAVSEQSSVPLEGGELQVRVNVQLTLAIQ